MTTQTCPGCGRERDAEQDEHTDQDENDAQECTDERGCAAWAREDAQVNAAWNNQGFCHCCGTHFAGSDHCPSCRCEFREERCFQRRANFDFVTGEPFTAEHEARDEAHRVRANAAGEAREEARRAEDD